MGHLYHGYVSHNQRVSQTTIQSGSSGSGPTGPNFHVWFVKNRAYVHVCCLNTWQSEWGLQ